MDSDRDKSPFVFDKNGKPLDRNPFKDPRVRKAISPGGSIVMRSTAASWRIKRSQPAS